MPNRLSAVLRGFAVSSGAVLLLAEAIVGWPCPTVEGICPGSICVWCRGGDHPRGGFSKGEIIGGPLDDVDSRSTVVAMFRKMTDPRRGTFL
jgi:hypothetical protein